jgi:DNA-binding transcriptional regulator LsrR (DeoR family)
VHVAVGTASAADPAALVAEYVERALDDAKVRVGDAVLVSWGRAVYSLARSLVKPRPGLLVAPALGGSREDKPWFQPNEIVRTLAAGIDGTPRFLHAPAFASPSLKRSLQRESTIKDTLDLWATAKVALVGIGNWPKDPHIAAAGFPTDDPAFARATGDVAARFFTEDGTPVPYRAEPRLLGVSRELLSGIPHWRGHRHRKGGSDRRSGTRPTDHHPGHRRPHGQSRARTTWPVTRCVGPARRGCMTASAADR